jgi:DNA-binding NarL/FixJ family response regulator
MALFNRGKRQGVRSVRDLRVACHRGNDAADLARGGPNRRRAGTQCGHHRDSVGHATCRGGSTGAEAVQANNRLLPDVTLLDVQMAGMSGIEATRAIREITPTAKVIILITFSGDVQAFRALKAGACGYLIKNMLRKELILTIRSVNAGQRRIPPEIAMGIVEHSVDDALSPREIEILASAARGLGNRAIATHWHISEETVKTHIARILDKLGANDRTHAVTIAIKRGILSI